MINQNKTEIAIWLRAIIRPQRLQFNYINMCAACFIVRPGTVFFCLFVFYTKAAHVPVFQCCFTWIHLCICSEFGVMYSVHLRKQHALTIFLNLWWEVLINRINICLFFSQMLYLYYTVKYYNRNYFLLFNILFNTTTNNRLYDILLLLL